MPDFLSIRKLRSRQKGVAGYLLLWLLGVPVPILVVIYLIRSCA
jgi:hypothetical protein